MSTIANNVAAKLFGALVAVAMLFTLITPAQAQTAEELQQMINDLLAQVASLQAQLGGGGSMSAAGVCPYTWTRSLTTGASGADVMKLQQFLNADPETRVAATGVGSAGQETEYFGGLTGAAVSKFQSKYRSDVLSPLGLVNPTTYFGPSTMAKANSLCSTAMADSADSADDSADSADSGGALSSSEASIDNDYKASSGDDTDLEEGQKDAPVMDVEFDVEDGDIKIGRVDIAVTHTAGTETNPWDVFDELSIWVDGDKIAETDVNSKSDWEKDKPAGGNYRVRMAGLSQIWREDETAEFTVGVTLQDAIDGNTGTWDIFIPTDGIRGRDGAGIDQYTGDTTDTVSFSFGAEGGDDELIVKSSSNDPDSTTLALEDNAKSDWFDVFVYDLDTDDSINDITVETLAVGVQIGSSTATFDTFVDDARLEIDGDTYNDFSYTDGAGVTLLFDIDDELVIDAGDRIPVTLQLKFNQLDAVGNEGTEIYATSSGDMNVADGADDLSGNQLRGAATGETHTVRTQGAILEFVSASETYIENDDQSTADNEGSFVIKFDVTAFETDLWIDDNAASGTVENNTGVNYTVTSGGVVVSTPTSVVEDLNSTADLDGARFKVNEGETETFTLTVEIDPVTSGFHRLNLYSVNWNDTNADADTQQLALPATDYRTDTLSI